MKIALMSLDISLNENCDYEIEVRYGKIFDEAKGDENVEYFKKRMVQIKEKFTEVMEHIINNTEVEE